MDSSQIFSIIVCLIIGVPISYMLVLNMHNFSLTQSELLYLQKEYCNINNMTLTFEYAGRYAQKMQYCQSENSVEKKELDYKEYPLCKATYLGCE